MVLEMRAVSYAIPIITSHVCRLTMPIAKGCCARDSLPHIFGIGVFKCSKNNSIAIKHINNESVNLNDSCDVAS